MPPQLPSGEDFASASRYAAAFQSKIDMVARSEPSEKILDIRVRDASGLMDTLSLIGKFFDDSVCLEVFKDKGLQIRAVDQAKISFVDAFFPSASAYGQMPVFSRFECDRPYWPMWVQPMLLGRAIRVASEPRKSTGNSRPYVLRLGVAASDPDHLIIEAETVAGSGQRSYGVTKSTRQHLALLTPTSDNARCFVDGEAFTFTGEALFDAPDLLSEILADVKSSGCEEVALTLTASSLQLSGKAGDNCSSLQVSLRSSAAGAGAVSLNAPANPVRAQYKTRHLQRLSHLCADSSRVLLQVGEEAPLSATFELRGGGTCQLFIAPCLEDEDLGGDEEPVEAHTALGSEGPDVKQSEHVERPKKRSYPGLTDGNCWDGQRGARHRDGEETSCENVTVAYGL